MNRYTSVYFWIKSGYGVNGMPDEDKRSFYSEVKSLFEKADWSIKEHKANKCGPTAHTLSSPAVVQRIDTHI